MSPGPTISRKAAHQRRSAADRGEHRQAAGIAGPQDDPGGVFCIASHSAASSSSQRLDDDDGGGNEISERDQWALFELRGGLLCSSLRKLDHTGFGHWSSLLTSARNFRGNPFGTS
jgi:hypothetical protein